MGKKKNISIFKYSEQKRPRGRPPKYITVYIEKMDSLNKIGKLKLEGNIYENWKTFKSNFEIFYVAAELNKKAEEVQAAILLNTIGEEGLELFRTLDIPEGDKKCYKKVLEAFDKFCATKQNIIYESFVFLSRNQKPFESIDAWIMDLKKLIKACEYKDQEDRMLRDRIILGCNDPNLQKKLLECDNVTANKIIEIITRMGNHKCSVRRPSKIRSRSSSSEVTSKY